MAVQNPDYIMPISDRNRQETFLVPLNHAIRSLNQALIIYMIGHPNDYTSSEYPLIGKIRESGKDVTVYNIAVSTPMRYLLSVLREDSVASVSDKDWKTIMDIRKKYRPINLSFHTRLEVAFAYLSKQKICNHFYICDKELDQSPGESELANLIFEESIREAPDKISFHSESIERMLELHPDITTVFLEEEKDLYEIVTSHNENFLQNKDFWLSIACRENIQNLEKSLDGTELPKIPHMELYNDFESRKICKVEYYFPLALDKS